MISAANTRVFQAEWFNLTGGYAIPKAEFQDQINTAIAELKKQSAKSYACFTERVRNSGKSVQLTEAQKRELAEFDPEHMSHLEYQAFLDKLCEFGILNEADKAYTGYGAAGCGLDMTPLDRVRTGGYITPAVENPMGYTNAYSSSGGNVLDWAKYLSGITVLDQESLSWQKSPEAILFEKIRNVLEEIAA